MENEEILKKIITKLREYYKIKLEDKTEENIYQKIKTSLLKFEDPEDTFKNLYKQYPEKELFIRLIEKDYFGKEFSFDETVKYYFDIDKVNVTLNNIDELTTEYHTKFPQFKKKTIKNYFKKLFESKMTNNEKD